MNTQQIPCYCVNTNKNYKFILPKWHFSYCFKCIWWHCKSYIGAYIIQIHILSTNFVLKFILRICIDLLTTILVNNFFTITQITFRYICHTIIAIIQQRWHKWLWNCISFCHQFLWILVRTSINSLKRHAIIIKLLKADQYAQMLTKCRTKHTLFLIWKKKKIRIKRTHLAPFLEKLLTRLSLLHQQLSAPSTLLVYI